MMINKRKNFNKRTSFGIIEKLFQYLAFSILIVKNCLFLTAKALQTVNTLSFHFKTIFYIAVLFGSSSQAQSTNCKNIFSSPRSSESFKDAMSKNLLLQKHHDYLFESYINSSFVKTNWSSNYKQNFKKIHEILEKHPEISKIPLREYQIIFFQKEDKKPKSLIHFLKSFRNSAGRIRNNLFQIEANWGLWAKALDFTRKNELKEKQQFLEYLETTPLNKKFRQFIANSKNSEENSEFSAFDHREKSIAFYQALSTLREGFQNNPKAFEFLSQAMSDLIHISGFENEFYSELLKSKIPLDNVKGAYNILLERDFIAEELGFKEGFIELQASLNIKHKDNFTEQLRVIEKEIKNNQSFTLKTKEVLRLRPLSLHEAPFRGCLGNDCSTKYYFDLALDPNYLYFTLTNDKHQSFGQVTVVLGEAKDKTRKTVNVAFVDKIQSIPIEKITAVLEGIRLSLKEYGYKLALPQNVGGPNGLSDKDQTRIYIDNEVLPSLETGLLKFKPFNHKYSFEKQFSRADLKLSLWEFDSYKKKESVEILKGEIYLPTIADHSLSIKNIYQSVLSMKNSKKEEEQILFLKNLVTMNHIEDLKISNKYVEDHLLSILQNPNMSFKVRKIAFFTLIQFKTPLSNKQQDILDLFKNQMESFSEEEKTLILGEMSNWKNSKESYKRDFIPSLHFISLNEGVSELKFLSHKSIWKNFFDPNIRLNASTMLHTASKTEGIDKIQWLIKNGADINAVDGLEKTALGIAAQEGYLEIVKILVQAGADINARNINGETPLKMAVERRNRDIVELLIQNKADPNVVDLYDRKSPLMTAVEKGSLDIVKILIQAGADINTVNAYGETPLKIAVKRRNRDMVELLIQNKADPNVVDIYYNAVGETALKMAVGRINRDMVELLIQNKADPNVVDIYYKESPLMTAVEKGSLDIVKILIQAGADINARNNIGETALKMAVKRLHRVIVELLIQNKADPNVVDLFYGDSPLMTAVEKGSLDIVKILIEAGADINARNRNGKTAFDIAMYYKDINIAKELNNTNSNILIWSKFFLSKVKNFFLKD